VLTLESFPCQSKLSEVKETIEMRMQTHYFFLSNLQVNIDIEDINDSVPSFESSTVRISVPENFELGVPFYVVSASDRDSGKSGTVSYRLFSGGSIPSSSVTSNSISTSAANLFNIDLRTGHLTLSHHLDFETSQRHTLIVTATDQGEPPLSSNLTIFLEVQDVNDNR
jgi:protocadherin-16/23